MKKKFVSIFMTVMIAASAILCSSCGDPREDFYGKWSANSETWGEFALEFTEDGNVDFTYLGDKHKGTWEYDEEKEMMVVNTDDLGGTEITENGGELSLDFGGDTIVFEQAE